MDCDDFLNNQDLNFSDFETFDYNDKKQTEDYDNYISRGTGIDEIINNLENRESYNNKEIIFHDMENMNNHHYNIFKPKKKEKFNNQASTLNNSVVSPVDAIDKQETKKEIKKKRNYYFIYGLVIGIITLFLLNLISKLSRK